MSNTPAPPEDQARLLEDALIAVRQQTALMRKCLETPGKLMDALKCWYVVLYIRHAAYVEAPS
jgi:vacuolar protein sorting-associated protein 35